MATLTVDSLVNCSSIPSFIPGGTRMLFNNTTAPTSWTKDTTSHNDKFLRIVTGTISSGGTSPFITAFPDTARPVQGTVSTVSSSVSIVQETVSPVTTGLINSITQSPITINARDLTTAQVASHDHTYSRRPNTSDLGLFIVDPQNVSRVDDNLVTDGFQPASTAGGHQHALNPVNRQQHDHPVSVTQHSHTISSAGPHSHPFTVAAQDFSISYVDLIIAQKDPD